MKHITYILFLFLLPLYTLAQNHVPNGNFEYYTNCPAVPGQPQACIGWLDLTYTPDYHNTCCTTSSVKVPNNFAGYQPAASGNGYMGIACNPSSWRESIQCHITPLTPGVTYSVSFSLCRGQSFKYASDNFGIFFYDTIGTINTTTFMNIVPQVSFLGSPPPTDTVNWIRYSTTFHADSAYDNIILGGFYADTSVNFITVTSTGDIYSYYYIDSLVIKPDSANITISVSDTNICANDTTTIDIVANQYFNSNNTFTVELSDGNGSFSNATNIGSLASDTSCSVTCIIPSFTSIDTGYKIRVITSSPMDTFILDSITHSIGNLDSTSIAISSNTPLCENGLLQITTFGPHINLFNYSWTGPLGFTSSLHNPSIPNMVQLNAGIYYLTSKLYGCERKDTVTVVVKPLPNKPVASGNTPICEYDSLHLTSSATTPGITYNWTGPNGFTSTTNNTSLGNIGFANGGSYIVTATKDGCSSYDTVNIIVNDAPDSVNISYNMPCSGDTLKLIADTSSGSASYSWSGPNGFGVNTQNTFIPSSNINHTGWYVMTATIGSCSYTDSVYAVVNQKPVTPTITYNNPICVSETLNLNAIGNSSTFYSWTGANSFSASGKTATRTNLQLADSGVYIVTATENGCAATDSAHISINPTPFVNILSVDSICDGETVTFSTLPSNAGANPQYNWFVNAQKIASGQTYTTTSLNNNDVIYCEMTDNTKCSSPYTDQSNTITMTVLPWLAPSVSITSNPTGLLQPWQYVTFTANPANAGSSPQYQWKRNGQDIVGATGSTWSANNLNDNDSISVELVSDYKCPQPATAMSNGIVVSVAVGLNDVNTLNNVSLIPNPNNGQFVLKGNVAKNGTADITIINTLGQIVHSSETNITDQTINERINLNDVASGLYLLRLDINGQRANIKFRVE